MSSIKKLKELDEKATPGPWDGDHLDQDDKHSIWAPINPTGTIQLFVSSYGDFDKHNCEAVATLRNSLPQLIERLEDADRMADDGICYCDEDPYVSPNRRKLIMCLPCKYKQKWMGDK